MLNSCIQNVNSFSCFHLDVVLIYQVNSHGDYETEWNGILSLEGKKLLPTLEMRLVLFPQLEFYLLRLRLLSSPVRILITNSFRILPPSSA